MVNFGLAPNGSGTDDVGMPYIVTRNQRFYVVVYDGIDRLTGRERRRWHPAGASRTDAEAIAATVDAAASPPPDSATRALTVGRFLTEQWMPRRRSQLRATTAHRYEWMIDNYINPRIGDVHLRGLRIEHIDRLYHKLLTSGSRTGGELASQTVYDVHVIIRSSLADAVRRSLVGSNVALMAHAPRAQPRSRCGPETWTAGQLHHYLASAAHLRLYPALHVAATTGMRRGGVGCNTETATPSNLATRSSPTPPGARCTPNQSANSSTGTSPAPTSHASASTTYDTPTPACSSPPAHRSKSSPNDSATPTPALPWPPTNTSSRDERHRRPRLRQHDRHSNA